MDGRVARSVLWPLTVAAVMQLVGVPLRAAGLVEEFTAIFWWSAGGLAVAFLVLGMWRLMLRVRSRRLETATRQSRRAGVTPRDKTVAQEGFTLGKSDRQPAPEKSDDDSESAELPNAFDHLREDAQFTVYRPRVLAPRKWHPMLCFAHLADRPPGAREDEPHPLEVVKTEAVASLGSEFPAYQRLIADATQPIPRDGMMTFVPDAPGIEFFPPSRSFIWTNNVHKEEFSVRTGSLQDSTVRGSLSVYCGSILIAEIALVFHIGEGTSRVQAPLQADSARAFRRIFASYSHRDLEIVQQFGHYADALGDEFLRDITHLRSGEVWNDRLHTLIRSADVFQLFWSWNSLDSPFVEKEWRYALSLGRTRFLRPVYWETPMPSRTERDLPPEELRRLHFRFLDLGRSAVAPFAGRAPHPPAVRMAWEAIDEVSHADENRSQAPGDSPSSGNLIGSQNPSRRADRRFVTRQRSPRVHIEYTSDTCGAENRVTLPFVVGVLSDLSGKPTETLPSLGDRKFVEIDVDNIDEIIESIKPRVAFEVENRLTGDSTLAIDITFENMDDFSPTGVAKKVPELKRLLDGRRNSAELGKIDHLLTEQVNPILHHEDFQRLESAWRGLGYLVEATETDKALKIRVLDVSKADLKAALTPYAGSLWDRSPLFGHVYDEPYGVFGGEPYGCLVGDYSFDQSTADIDLLRQISLIAAAAHAPFIASAGPSMLGMESFEELGALRDLAKRFGGPDYAGWRSFRNTHESCYVGLTLPRTLGRLPYGEQNPVRGFNFVEEASREMHENYLWTNPAYAFVACLTRAFSAYGWCVAITGARSGGLVQDLPFQAFNADDGTIDAKCPTEIAITDVSDNELGRLGFIPLCHYKNTDFAVFFAAQSTNKPQEFSEDAATATADLMSKIPYTMAVARFAHYLKVMHRDNLGSLRERKEIEQELQGWIARYVLLNPENANPAAKAKRPLAGARVEVLDVPGEPGHYEATMWIRPHFMLAELDVDLRLVVRLPAVGSSLETTIPSAVRDHEDTRRLQRLAEESSMPVPITDQVHFTATAPATVVPRNWYPLDVWAHLAGQRSEVLKLARDAQGGEEVISRSKGGLQISQGTAVVVQLDLPAFRVADCQDILVWSGEIGNATFCFHVPPETKQGQFPGTVLLHAEGLRLAKLHFVIRVGTDLSEAVALETRQARYRTAFASYASKDRDEVLGRVQGMQKILPDLEVFLDVVRLRSGENWRDHLLREVASRDVFYLFWSRAAKSSNWVEEEWRAALRQRGIEYIDPVPLISPEIVPPPEELAGELHFNDWILAYRRGTSC